MPSTNEKVSFTNEEQKMSVHLMQQLNENHEMIRKTRDNLMDFVGYFMPQSNANAERAFTESIESNGWVEQTENEIRSQRENLQILEDLVAYLRQFI